MILILRSKLPEANILQICEHLQDLSLSCQIVRSYKQIFVVVLDDTSSLPSHTFSRIDGVEKVVRTAPQCPLVGKSDQVVIRFENGSIIGGGALPAVIAGPCSVEGRVSVMNLACQVKDAGAQFLRGGAYKPRTSPYDFCGLGEDGLKYLHEAGQAAGLPVVSEVMSAEQVELAEPYVDVYQIGARNMYNYELLRQVGRSRRPVLLKRAFSAPIHEFLQAAEYILLEGNLKVILCERGIRSFETHTRNTLDLSAVAALKTMTSLPVIVDPSHATGRRELIRPMSRAAIACGADGLLIEVHNDPPRAMSDGAQAITPNELEEIVRDVNIIHFALSDYSKDADSSVPALLPLSTVYSSSQV